MLGADVRLGEGATATLPDDVDLRGHLARLEARPRRCSRRPAPAASRSGARSSSPGGCATPTTRAPVARVTGTNGKTTTVQMLDAILRAAGLRSVAVGNVGLPIVEAVMDPEPYDVLAVELSSFQLHYTDSMSAESAAVLNVAEDHLDWYPARWPSTPPTRAASTSGCSGPASTTSPTPRPSGWSARPTSIEGARAIGFTLGMPGVGMLGVVEDILADRAFIEQRDTSAAELCTIADLASPGARTSSPTRSPRPRWPAPTASPRPRSATGCAPSGPTATGSRPSPSVDGVTWVDDSKATNPHAAQSSLLAYDPVVWVAGGLAKGARFDDLVLAVRDRLRGVVLLGRDRDVIAEALSRHAPDVPVIVVGDDETGRT